MMNPNIRAPLYNPDVKIGQSGPINWYMGANCQRTVIQFSSSIWNNQKFDVKQKVEFELALLRQSLALFRDVNRMNYIIIPSSLGMLIALLIYIIVLSNGQSNGRSDNVSGVIAVYLTVMILMLVITFGAICYFVNKMNGKIQVGLCFLNQKLQQQGLNVTVVSKRKVPFPSALNFMYVDVYERIHL